MANKEIHAVMVPFLGFGHLIPFRQLAITLAQKGVRVSFISTPKNIQKLDKIPTELAPLINMVEFQLPVALENGAEASVDIPYEQMSALMGAYDLLKQQFQQFVVQQSPDWIFVDAQSIWAVEVAQEYGVKVILFSVFTAAFMTFLGLFESLKEEREKRLRLLPESIMKSPEWVDFPSAVAYRRYEAAGFKYLYKVSGRKSFSERFFKGHDVCQAIAIRSCEEIESEYLRVLVNVAQKPVFPVGLLLHEQKSETMEEIQKGKWGNMFKWLDEQDVRSVVFVGFGSECKLVKEEVHEIAYGLEISKLPFLWMLQNPDWDLKDEDGDQGPLPAGFRSRTSSQGFVKFGWAPQKEILAHPSITCSLFHSGWGSAIENLQHGNSLVVLPLVYDQFLTARLLVEKGLAIEIDRKEDGTFSRDDIAKSLKLAMFSKQGEEIRNRAANVFADPMLHLRHDHCVSKFVEYLKK